MSARSSTSSIISCKSMSVSGRCSTGRHTDRNKRCQKKFRNKIIKRDECCIATGITKGLVAAHIIPLNRSELITRELLFSGKNGILLHEDLEDDYDRHKWIFDQDGNVVVLFNNWLHKGRIQHVNISKDPAVGPSMDLIALHNALALEEKKHYCPNCWKYVGEVNVENHIAGSCERLDKLGDENDDTEDI